MPEGVALCSNIFYVLIAYDFAFYSVWFRRKSLGYLYRPELCVVRVWRGQYREEQILNFTVFVVRVWGGQYREELVLNVTVLVVRVWRREIKRRYGGLQ